MRTFSPKPADVDRKWYVIDATDLVVRQGTVPDFSAQLWGDAGTNSDYYDWQVKMQKAGPERYVMLPQDGQDYLIPADYYIAVISEGQNPVEDASWPQIGSGNSSAISMMPFRD